MKITPLEIRQKDFEKKLRGYDKDEVNAFLQSLSNEWERVLEENKELNIKLQQAEKEVAKLREVETSLYKTLKTAEDTGANVIDQANKAAELHMKETQMNAEALLNESKNKARAMIEQAEMEARQIIEELQDAVKGIEQNHRDIENHRQLAIQELKNLSVTLIEKVERNTQETKEFRFDDYVKRVKQLARESEERIKSEKTEVSITTKDLETPKMDVGSLKSETVEEKTASDSKAEVETPKEIPVFKKQEEQAPTPPKTEELKEKILKKEKPEYPKFEQPKTVPEESSKVEESVLPKKETPAEEPEEVEASTEEMPKEDENKKGPRISKTVSFFDELDTD